MDALNSLAVAALNHLVRGESWAQDRLRGHAGALVHIAAGPFTVRLGIDEHGLFHSGNAERDADVTITLPADVPARLLFDRDKLFSSVKLGGAADIAESLAFVLRNLRRDVEADLARVVGDIAARRLVRLGQSLAGAMEGGLRKATENFVEYAVEESPMLAAKRDVSEFVGAVDRVRDDLARLEQRISRL